MASKENIPVAQLYQKLEIIGRGSYGSVYKGRENATGNIVALKIINLDTEDDDVDDIQREVNLLSQLRGGEKQNVTMYYGCQGFAHDNGSKTFLYYVVLCGFHLFASHQHQFLRRCYEERRMLTSVLTLPPLA